MRPLVQYIIALLIAPVLAACAATPVAVTSKSGSTFGKIYVDTPEVYSRERLVNDRFQQDAWLREKLRENPDHAVQGAIGTSSASNTNLSLAVGVKPKTAPGQAAEKSVIPSEVGDTAVEALRDTMAYREEVRNEILENQLDDRHDIAGNTLYRLKFDTTVIPHDDTSAYAMVEVTIKGAPFWDMSGDFADVRYPGDFEEFDMPLPDFDFAPYVTGLDEEAMKFYKRVYRDWLRDIDPSKYTEEDFTFGSLQPYFFYDADFGEIEAKRHCEDYFDAEQQQAAMAELIDRNVPVEYLEASTLIDESSYTDEFGNEYVEREVIQLVCVQTGLANFIADLKDKNTAVYTYAVTPKERVQRVYGNSLAAGSTGLSFGAEQGAVGAALAHSAAREARANTIMRQPQIVGYSADAHRSSEATMGWLIGPRYKISNDPDALVSFRHVPSQHTLTGIVSVPSWWGELVLETRTYWLDENGVEYSADGKVIGAESADAESRAVQITLPADVTTIYDVLDPKRREPRVNRFADRNEPTEIRACEEASVIIRGTQLWRSTVVTLGGQQADVISVLPNMEGVVATFHRVEPSISGTESLNIWTSEGEEFVREMSIIGECASPPAA